MNELTNTRFLMPQGQELNEIINFAKVMAGCPYYQKLGAGGVLAIIMTAKEMNLPMMSCLNGGMYTFNGAVTISAQLMNAMIIRNGHSIEILELNDTKCSISFRRKGATKDFIYNYDIERAKKAGYLTKDNWKENPKDMLFARCLSGGARKVFPDVLGNLYVQGEIIELETKIDTKIDTTSQDSKPEEQKTLEFSKVEGFEDFVSDHCLKDKISEKARYIKSICEKTNKTFDEIVYLGMQNKDKFQSGFDKWVISQPEHKESITEHFSEDSTEIDPNLHL